MVVQCSISSPRLNPRLPCGSISTPNTAAPRRCRPVNSAAAVVVFPTPPFWFVIAITVVAMSLYPFHPSPAGAEQVFAPFRQKNRNPLLIFLWPDDNIIQSIGAYQHTHFTQKANGCQSSHIFMLHVERSGQHGIYLQPYEQWFLFQHLWDPKQQHHFRPGQRNGHRGHDRGHGTGVPAENYTVGAGPYHAPVAAVRLSEHLRQAGGVFRKYMSYNSPPPTCSAPASSTTRSSPPPTGPMPIW